MASTAIRSDRHDDLALCSRRTSSMSLDQATRYGSVHDISGIPRDFRDCLCYFVEKPPRSLRPSGRGSVFPHMKDAALARLQVVRDIGVAVIGADTGPRRGHAPGRAGRADERTGG